MFTEFTIKAINMEVEDVKNNTKTKSSSRLTIRRRYGIEAVFQCFVDKRVEEILFDPMDLKYIFKLGSNLDIKSTLDIKRVHGTPVTIKRTNKNFIRITAGNAVNDMYRITIPISKWREISEILSTSFGKM